MYFLNEEHKSNFANFLDERSYSETFDTYGHLVAFYVNAIPSVTTGNYYRAIGLFVWIGQFDEEKNKFVPSEQFLALSKEKQKIGGHCENFI